MLPLPNKPNRLGIFFKGHVDELEEYVRDVGDDRLLQIAYSRAPKIAVPTRTWVAPNSMARAKSALMPMDNSASPLRAAIFASKPKCGAGGSSSGGMHINPSTASPYSPRQRRTKTSTASGKTPAFCGSAPVLT